ncbi:MAG: hypothetical protein GFH27_549349n107 [Chloroflexi bacterium AL-W]|nr:hypothetical protein [Chloroflexi bacterium AL-N1]NOK70005.1 hypothetical protein [Chloroflexi bacterium AL-N10]NOK73697.1 hypothetical protein [Chloroflexi bacterium AL-N5]NOK85537.1 hypothetical protein [Chloroflexi bacterium AL-W]NOK91738.1 hypothetical protein [Chloroflexi bacterium AL-N15]
MVFLCATWMVPGVEAASGSWGSRYALQPASKCGVASITGNSEELKGGSSGGGSVVHWNGDYRYVRLGQSGNTYTYSMDVKRRIIGGPKDTNGQFLWGELMPNVECTKQSITCVNLSVTRNLLLDNRDWPGNIGDSKLSTIRLNHNQVCVDRSTGLIVSGNNPQFMNLNNGFGITFDDWGSAPNFNPGNGIRRAHYSILGKYELSLWELLDWLNIPAGINDLRVILHATTFVDTTGRRICLELYNPEFTQGVWASGTNRVYFTGHSRNCVPY